MLEIANSPFVSISELDIILSGTVSVKGTATVDIRLQNAVDRFDISFIAGLLLKSQVANQRFNLAFSQTANFSQKRKYEVWEYVNQYAFLYNKEWRDVFPDMASISNIRREKVLFSKSFAPILMISADTIRRIFGLGDSKCKFRVLAEEYLSFTGKSNRFLTVLKASDVISTLKTMSPIHAFVFRLLIEKIDPVKSLAGEEPTRKIKIAPAELEEYVERVNEVFEFTCDYVRGLHELAKNIVEHSETDGIITIRIYNDVDPDRIGLGKILETTVFDYGSTGIIPKLKHDTKEKVESFPALSDAGKLYRHDLEILSTSYKLVDFIRPRIEVRLFQQLYRALAHYGLMKFYKMIERTEGSVVSSSVSTRDGRDFFANHMGLEAKTLSRGTCYFFQLPFNPALSRSIQRSRDGHIAGSHLGEVPGLARLFDIRIVQSVAEADAGLSSALICNTPLRDIQTRADENAFIKEFDEFPASKALAYVAVNLEGTRISSSSLLRILAHLSAELPQAIIIYGVSFLILDELLEDNKLFFKTLADLDDTPFWFEGKSVLVYSMIETKRFHFADMLCGADEDEYRSVNQIMNTTFPNTTSIVHGDFTREHNVKIPAYLAAYFYKSYLLPFDVLLSSDSAQTIFQDNLQTLLENEIMIDRPEPSVGASKVEKLELYVGNADGYKLVDSHFRIGSKIHSKDFFYAKRLFENSYYTSRIAMMIATDVKSAAIGKEVPRTLVGYEMYSELLLSQVRRFLEEVGYRNLNHVVVLDTDPTSHLPGGRSVANDVVLIVPIASTGSTSVKIEKYLKTLNPAIEVTKSFHVITAYDPRGGSAQASGPERNVIASVSTEWQSPLTCKWCFRPEMSKPLFETDRSSLTPAMIFSFPAGKSPQVWKVQRSVEFGNIDFEKALVYGKARRNGQHFIFSTDTDQLIADNLSTPGGIKDWLDTIKHAIFDEGLVSPTDKIVMISPSHHTNSQFINIVNDRLFDSSATMIHYQTGVDHLANFKLLNEKYLIQQDSKVFFVDDALITGDTFFSIYGLLRLSIKGRPPLAGAIFLSNKSAPEVNERVEAAGRHVFAFANVNLPASPKISERKPFEHEIIRYGQVADFLLHDVMKSVYQSKKTRLAEEYKGIGAASAIDRDKRRKHLQMYKATHRLYEFFGSVAGNFREYRLTDLLRACEGHGHNKEVAMAYLKVLCQYPFLLYVPVRERAFEWHREWLAGKTTEILGKSVGALRYDDLTELKFLIRRSVFLGNYVIFTHGFFKMLAKCFDVMKEKSAARDGEGSKPGTDLFEIEVLSETQKVNISNFHIFLIGQYAEMTHRNPWCAAQILEVEPVFRHFRTNQGRQFVRMLQIESAAVLNDFFALLQANEDWVRAFLGRDFDFRDDALAGREKLRGFFRAYGQELLQTNKWILADKVLHLTKDGILTDQFLDYIWLKTFFQQDPAAKEVNLSEKNDAIFQRMKGLFKTPAKIGAFFVVADAREKYHLVFDRDATDQSLVGESLLDSQSIILNFLSGESDRHQIAYRSIAEYSLVGGNWIDNYNPHAPQIRNQFSVDQDWMMMIRISDGTSAKLGVLGFYGNRKTGTPDVLAKRLLMLLRSDFGVFIKRHHKNDEFGALREAELTRRFAYLAGHGRHMMQKLASKNQEVFGEVVAAMEKLQYLFATRLIPAEGYGSEYKLQVLKLLKLSFPAGKIDQEVLNRIYGMGNNILSSTIVENAVNYNVQWDNPPTNFGTFSFNVEILKFICFELFVNAKKNRYHFSGNKSGQNFLIISFVRHEEQLCFTITNSGPRAHPEIMAKINGGTPIKAEHEISGIFLLTSVIRNLHPHNLLQMDCLQVDGDMWSTTVTVSLNAM